MKQIMVKTPNGMRFHGMIDGAVFKRIVPGKYIRWSDHAFTVNVDCLNKIKAAKVIRFKYILAEKVEIREITKDQLLNFPRKFNEFSEENIRIPIEETKLIKTI